MEINIELYSFELTNYGFACAVAFALAMPPRKGLILELIYFTALHHSKRKALLDITSIFDYLSLASGMAYYAWKVANTFSTKLNAKPNLYLRYSRLTIPQAIWAVGLTFVFVCQL